MPEARSTSAGHGSFRQRLIERRQLLGSFVIEQAASAVADAYAQAGFDFVVIDTEHSAFDLPAVSSLVLACRAFGISPIIRVGDRGSTARFADLQPDALMYPDVRDVSAAEEIVELARYAPEGARGACPMVGFERIQSQRHETLNELLGLILQVEGSTGIRNAIDIASVAGVDAIFVGTYDLSLSLGIPGQLEDSRITAAGAQIASALPAGTAMGVYVQSSTMAREWTAVGASLIAYGTDGQLFLRACHDVMREVRHEGSAA